MYSFAFPNMLSSTQANLVQDKSAIRSNMILLLSSERDTLFGDPFYGSQLRKYIFEQRTSIVVDLVIDELYSTIVMFMPQVYLTRKDITIYSQKNQLFAQIKYYYVLDNTSDLFTIRLTEMTEEV